jgi:hypothetical protein
MQLAIRNGKKATSISHGLPLVEIRIAVFGHSSRHAIPPVTCHSLLGGGTHATHEVTVCTSHALNIGHVNAHTLDVGEHAAEWIDNQLQSETRRKIDKVRGNESKTIP